MIKQCKKYWIIGVLILCTLFSFTYQHLRAQTPGQVEQAKAKLSTMSPAEIEAALKKFGLTREEADAKAKAAGIDLESYLKARAANATPAAQPQTQVNIQVSPTQVTPGGNTGQPAVATPGVQMLSAPSLDTTKQVVHIPVAPTPIVTAPVVQAPEPSKPPQEASPFTGPEGIPYFGYNLFKAGPNAFEPRPNLADNMYIVGEGDVLRISLWGDTQSMAEYTVDAEGRILIQPAGPVLVAGYTFDQAKARVIRALSQSLSGLAAKPPTTFLDLTIARLRPVRAFVMGEVANPGTYSLSSFSTVFNALFTVGGPLLSGGMREVRLVRNGKTAAKVDLYDYLIGSEKTGDVRVNDNDIIYVPLRGRTVGIKGAVLRPAYFELLPNEQLKRLIEFSGGIRNTFYLERIQVNRIVPFAERKKGEPDRKIFDINYSDILASGKDYKLEDGDIITIFSILDEKKNFVILDGAVWRPGTYQLEKISTLKDLVKEADGLLPEAYLDRADVTRTYDDKHIEAININIGLAVAGDPAHNIALQPRDRVRIYSKYEMNPLLSVTISGHVKNPGTFPYAEKITLRDLLFIAGGLEDSLFRSQTYLERGTLMRLNPDLRTRRSIYFNPGEIFDEQKGDFLLEPDDQVQIFSRSEMREGREPVEVIGAAKRPGTYPLTTNLTLYNLIYDAVGLTDTVYRKDVLLETADLVRVNNDGFTSRIVPFNLWKLFTDKEGDTLLLPRDRVIIYPRTAIQERERYVDIYGSVKKPGHYALAENMTLVDLLLQAGGYTEDAYDVQAEIARITRTGLGKDSLVHTRFVKLPDLLVVSALTAQDIAALRLKSSPLQHRDQVFVRPNPAFVFQQFVTVEGEIQFPGKYALNRINERISHVIARAGGGKPNAYLRGGRMVRDGVQLRTNIENAVEDDEGPEDLVLKPGDVITIPKKMGTVSVNGNVNNPGIYGYAEGRSLSYYIDAAGDTKDSTDYAVITFPEGISKEADFGWFSKDPKIPDGSSIFVYKVPPPPPEIPDTTGKKTTTYDFVKDVLAILVSSVTVIVLAAKL